MQVRCSVPGGMRGPNTVGLIRQFTYICTSHTLDAPFAQLHPTLTFSSNFDSRDWSGKDRTLHAARQRVGHRVLTSTYPRGGPLLPLHQDCVVTCPENFQSASSIRNRVPGAIFREIVTNHTVIQSPRDFSSKHCEEGVTRQPYVCPSNHTHPMDWRALSSMSLCRISRMGGFRATTWIFKDSLDNETFSCKV